MLYNKEEVIIVIPARSGSKRLKFKNMMLINKKPMIYYTIMAALDSKVTQHIYVCTDCDEIAEYSRSVGAKVHKIKKSMAGDMVSSTEPCLDLCSKLIDDGKMISWLINLQPTSPLRNGKDIQNSMIKIIEDDADTLVSITKIDPHYFHWALIKKFKKWSMWFGNRFLKERLLLPDVYRPNGAIKLGKYEVVKKTKNFFSRKLSVYEMDLYRSIHVAEKFDQFMVSKIIEENYHE